MVKALRLKTGAGMMDCKKALSETGGDLEKAQEYLRKKGLSSAEKKWMCDFFAGIWMANRLIQQKIKLNPELSFSFFNRALCASSFWSYSC